VAVFTGQDAVADGMKSLTHTPMPGNPHEGDDPASGRVVPRSASTDAADRVRFVGEVVAMVVAETPAAARDGAERIPRDYAYHTHQEAQPQSRKVRHLPSMPYYLSPN